MGLQIYKIKILLSRDYSNLFSIFAKKKKNLHAHH